MGRNILILLLSFFALSAMANGPDWTIEQQKKKIKAEENIEKRQQRQEVFDADNLGGAKGGAVDEKESQAEKARHDAEKQKFLNQHDGYYRQGL